MDTNGDDRKLTARQRLGWLVIALLILSCLTVVIVRSARTHTEADTPIKVSIIPIPDDTAAVHQRAESAEKQKSEVRKKSSADKKKSMKKQKTAKKKTPKSPTPPQRDITGENL